MKSKSLRVVVILLLCLSVPLAVVAKKKKHQSGGKSFDYYLLSLSWAPDFCDLNPQKSGSNECSSGNKFGLVVHGMWPQFESGLGPMSCSGPSLDSDSKKIATQVMPDAGLAQHEWEKHGTCSGLSAHDYFTHIVTAFHSVKIPSEYQNLSQTINTTPQNVVQDFAKANNVSPDVFRVTCRSQELQEVDVCLDKNFQFRACGKVQSCTSRNIKILPPR